LWLSSLGALAELLASSLQVNVGRAGAANLDVIQEVEYVKEEAKLPYLLECLQVSCMVVALLSIAIELRCSVHAACLFMALAFNFPAGETE
jgi:hypothetical protein